MNYRLLYLILFCLLNTVFSYAQVTIGSSNKPVDGALLDLKEYSPKADNSTSQKGLLLPRVELQKVDELQFGNVIINDSDNGGNQKQIHKGLLVYNVRNQAPFCKGMYSWNGEKWSFLGGNCNPLGLSVTPESFYFWSGANGMTLEAKDLNISWNPTSALLSYQNVNVSGFAPVIFDQTSFSPSLESQPNKTVVKFKPKKMTASEIATTANPFLTKESLLRLSITYDGKTETKDVKLKQTNKAVLVNSSYSPNMVFYPTSATGKVAVQSNAKWKISAIVPDAKAVTIVGDVNTVYGSEKDDGTADASIEISYRVSTGSMNPRYSYVTFSDSEIPRRFNDVVLTVAQCEGQKDLTLKEYTNVWEGLYGLNGMADEPNSDGDVSTNINKTRWHYANPEAPSDTEIFLSSDFGPQGRWMTTNLVTFKYPERTDGSVFSEPIKWGAESTALEGYMQYPNGNESFFDQRQRVGILYNWYAVTAGRVTSSPGESTEQRHIQGICPKGWHVPSLDEFTNLIAYMKENALLYSDVDSSQLDIPSTSYFVMRDRCEYNLSGRSFEVTRGGFAYILSGGFENNTYMWYDNSGVWWTSTNVDSDNAYILGFIEIYKTDRKIQNRKSRGFPVRCKKD